MREVSIGVARHGKLIPVAVVVHPTNVPSVPWQSAKLTPVIVATAAVSTVTLNDEALQAHPRGTPKGAKENPRLPESILPSLVPTGDQLAADATDGNTNAHNANTTPKSNMLFFNISNTPHRTVHDYMMTFNRPVGVP